MKLNSNHAVAEEVVVESGRTWTQWLDELKSDKFKDLNCGEVEDILVHEYQLDRDWAAKITDRFASKDGLFNDSHPCFDASIRLTVDLPKDSVVNSTTQWFESEARAMEPQLNEDSILTCLWRTDHSRIAVVFEPKGDGQTEIILRHDRLRSQSDADIMHNFWEESLKGMVQAF